MEKKRMDYIDIVKAIAMISIVVFHSCTNNANTYEADHALLIRFGSAYGLPVFFFINGFLYNSSKPENIWGKIWKKVKAYYIPFVSFNMLYLFLHNFFVILHMVDENNGNGWYSLNEFVKHIVYVIMGKREYFSGALWFLGSLLIINVIIIVSEFLIEKFFKGKWHDVLVGLLVLVCVVLGASGRVTNQMKLATSLASMGYFLFGMIYRKYDLNEKLKRYPFAWLIVAIVLDVAVSYNKLNVVVPLNFVTSFVVDYIVGIVCIVAIMNVAQIKVFVESKTMKLIGNNTMDIMAFHFMIFKLVSLVIIAFYNLPINRLSDYPVVNGIGEAWWIAYSVVAIVICTIIGVFRTKLKQRIFGGRKE